MATNKEKWAEQLFTISGVSNKEFDDFQVRTTAQLTNWNLKTQMNWLKLVHEKRKNWKPQTFSFRPIYNGPDFVMDKTEITEVWRNESGEITKKIAHNIEEGFKQIEAWGKKVLKHGNRVYEEQN